MQTTIFRKKLPDMKILLSFIACIFTMVAGAQDQYWQQEVNYTIKVSLNDKDHSLTGTEEIEYINHSPNSLDFIWFHLWPNAYKNDNTAFAKQVLADKDGKDRLKKMKDKGYIDGLDFYVDGLKAKTELDPSNIDIIKVLLPK